MPNPNNPDDAHLATLLRTLFNTSPFHMLITEGLRNINGNPNGHTWACTRDGNNLSLDASGRMLREGKELIEAVVGRVMSQNVIRELDVDISGQGFCITLMGPPSTENWAWTVARRESVPEASLRPIAVSIDLDNGDILQPLRLDMGRAEPDVEGTFRRGYHQAVAAVAEAMRNGNIGPEELDAWVNGSGWRWRKETTLTRKLLPPTIGG